MPAEVEFSILAKQVLLLFRIISWEIDEIDNKHPCLKFVEINTWEGSHFAISWVKDFGGMHLGYALGDIYSRDGSYVEIGLGDSACGDNWFAFDES